MSDRPLPSAFDPAAFEASAGTTDRPLDTARIPVPAGEHNALIKDYSFRSYTNKKTNEQGVSMDITYDLIDDTGAIAQKIGRPPTVTHGYFVDLDAHGSFDWGKGKNVWLGKIREAIGQNVPGQSWGFPMMKGQPIKIVVIEDPATDGSDAIYNRVKGVGRVG